MTATERVPSEKYRVITADESLRLLRPLRIVGVDTETSGLNCRRDTLLTLQLGCHGFQVVIDCRTVDIMKYREYLESDRLFLFWNAKFDLSWLYRYRIFPKRVYDGFLGEKLQWLGYPVSLTREQWERTRNDRYDLEDDRYVLRMSLAKAGRLYLGVELDKSVRGRIRHAGLSDEVIEYAANDVKWLERLMDRQQEVLRAKGLEKAMYCMNRFIPALTYMECCGIRLDTERWKRKMDEDRRKLDAQKRKLDAWLVSNVPDSEYVRHDLQGDLWEGFRTEPDVLINWDSPKQVIPLFRRLGVSVTVHDKGRDKDSIEAKVLKPQAGKCSLIPLYIEYQELSKVCSTYGQNFLDAVEPETGRLYTRYSPLGTDTGRITSGGKESSGKKYVNTLNIPSDAETRACFVAEPGNAWISIDYSGQETFIMASLADEKAIIRELTEGCGDIHSLCAYMSYREIPRDTPVKDIKKLYHTLRQDAKSIEFAINYGGNADTISRNKGIPQEKAREIYDNYMSGFPGLKVYQDFRRKDWWDKGFIDMNPLVGFKVWIHDYDYLKRTEESFHEKGFWNHYREMKEYCPESHEVQRVRYFFKRKSSCERASINYPIQHTGALCYMVSMANFFEYLRKHGLLFKVLITVTPYDELNCEAPREIAEDIAHVLYDIMVRAGAFFVTKCKLDADISRLEDGTLPDHWIH